MRRILQWCAVAVLACAPALRIQAQINGEAPKRLLAYYFLGDKAETPPYTAAQIPYRKLTHLIHVIGGPASDGSLTVPPGVIEPELIVRAHAAHVKVLACVQGEAPVFSQVAADPALRNRFVADLHAFVVANSYDGVDIDWEVPANPADAANMVLLLQALRASLPSPKYLLSAATPATPGKWGIFDFPHMTPLVDFYNVMTYDYHGQWNDHAGYNSPLFPGGGDPAGDGSIDDTVNLYLGPLGVPPAKINIGTTFYGYEFPVAGPGLSCACRGNVPTRHYGPDIKPLLKPATGWTSHVDPVSLAPYLTHDADPARFLTYDDAASNARKVEYALRLRGLGGVFVWEISEDYDGKSQDLADSLYDAFVKSTK